MGESLELMRKARALVLASPLLGPPFLASSVYLTSPVGCPPESAPFLNAVIEAELTGEPAGLLRELLVCEEGLGRVRGERNGPRTIDLDLLYAGGMEVAREGLRLPHPRIGERRFVLAPLAEIRGGLVLPGQRRTVAQLLAELPEGETAERLEATW